jgi:hypothetical protein
LRTPAEEHSIIAALARIVLDSRGTSAADHATVKKHALTLPAPGPVILRIGGRSLIRKDHEKSGLDFCTVSEAEGCVDNWIGLWAPSFAGVSPEEQAKAETAQPPVWLHLHMNVSFADMSNLH